MEDKPQYLAIINEIINKQSIILGPEISQLKARNVSGLVFGGDGKVIDMQGNAEEKLQKLVDQYVELSGLIVKNALGSIFAKYPTIKKIQ
ncbi:MAG: hypothetical protein HW401_285 [Parcubacteria group bacterium]|nr:hypothetical protein [Parcubacteria group bacterium]